MTQLPAISELPKNTTPIGRYHTHGDEDDESERGNLDGGQSQFSPLDIRNADSERALEYLGTPNYEILKYTPTSDKTCGGQIELIKSSYRDPKILKPGKSKAQQ